jgi:WD40 repeat protein
MVARGDRVVSAYDDMSLKIWDAASGKCLMTLNGHLLTVKWVRVVE